MAVSLTKGDISGVTKRQLAKEVITLKQNQERYEYKIAEQDKQIAEQNEQIKELLKRLEVVKKRK